MKKITAYILLAILLVIGGFFVRTLFHDFGTTQANEVRIENGLILDAKGSPLNGTILGTINHAEEMVQPFLEMISYNDDWKKMSFVRKFDFQKLGAMKEELKGFSVHASVKDGKLSEKTNVYFDLRSSQDEVLGNPIQKNFKYYLGYLFSNQVKLAEANFENNKLNGDAFIYGLGSKKTIDKNVEIAFENNVPAKMKRYHRNGKIKRINKFKTFVKDGVQQEFSKDGALSYEVIYKLGKKVEEKSYYWKMDKLRKHVTISDSNLVVEKHYFPNGELAKEYNGKNKKEWYSNGDIKLSVTPDTSYYNKPKGKVETFHNSGSVYTMYNYDNLGTMNGPYERYYKSGKLWETGTYKNNRKDGNLKKWYTNGQIAEDHLMVSGNVNGPYVRYYDDGVLWKEFNYDNGRLTGKYKKWWKNGQLAYDCEYANNRPSRCEKWNDKGETLK